MVGWGKEVLFCKQHCFRKINSADNPQIFKAAFSLKKVLFKHFHQIKVAGGEWGVGGKDRNIKKAKQMTPLICLDFPPHRTICLGMTEIKWNVVQIFFFSSAISLCKFLVYGKTLKRGKEELVPLPP